MPRRSPKPQKWIPVAVLAAAGVVALVAYLISQAADPFRTSPALDIPSYVQNSSSLRGNTYKVVGEVSDSLAWSPTAGRLIAVAVDGGSRILPVQVSPEFSSVNIQKGQQFAFLLEVDENGILKTKDLKKP